MLKYYIQYEKYITSLKCNEKNVSIYISLKVKKKTTTPEVNRHSKSSVIQTVRCKVKSKLFIKVNVPSLRFYMKSYQFEG